MVFWVIGLLVVTLVIARFAWPWIVLTVLVLLFIRLVTGG